MPKFPEPPPAGGLAGRLPPELKPLRVGDELWRIYFRGGRYPALWGELRRFGPTGARFDHHPPPPRVHPDRAILYAAGSALTALAEVFQKGRTIDRVRNDPWLVAFMLARDVKLLDLTGNWPTQAGASMVINSGPQPRAQRWSRRIHGDYPVVEGLYYSSSMHRNLPAVALYERAITALPVAPSFHRALADPTLLAVMQNAAQELGYRLR